MKAKRSEQSRSCTGGSRKASSWSTLPSDVLGNAAWRVYKAVLKEVYKRSEDTVNGQYITTRVRVHL